MKRPSFQFYPADWRKDPALSSCSLAAQGLWINLICIMHEAEEYGCLVLNGKPLSEAQIARQVGTSIKNVVKYLLELESAGVFSRNEQDIVFSRRMVKDDHLRVVRSQAGKLGGNPNLLNQKVNLAPNQDHKQSPTPSSSSSSSKEKRERESASAQKFSDDPGKSVNPGTPPPMPERPKHAPGYEQVLEYFQRQGVPELVEAFMVDNDKTDWTYRDGTNITNWPAWAAGFIRKQQRKHQKAAPEPEGALPVAEQSDDPDEGHSSAKKKFRQFQQWVNAEAPRVAQMKEPFTFEQWEKATREFGKIGSVLKSMHNYEPLLKKNRSAYLTLCNWKRRELNAA